MHCATHAGEISFGEVESRIDVRILNICSYSEPFDILGTILVNAIDSNVNWLVPMTTCGRIILKECVKFCR